LGSQARQFAVSDPWRDLGLTARAFSVDTEFAYVGGDGDGDGDGDRRID
jgi:hypothetical protein